MTDVFLCANCGTRVSDCTVPCHDCGQDTDLANQYRLLEEVGRGSSGTTYRALDLSSGSICAIKEITLNQIDPVLLDALEREARVLQQISHDQIPDHLNDFLEGRGKRQTFYLVQSFVEGENLIDEMLNRRYTEDEIIDILDEVLSILEYLHNLRPPVIHRDIKLSNLIRRKDDGRLVLIDFGSVRDSVKHSSMGGDTITGTYGYMAPEQFRGDASPRSDLYAIGALAVALLSRRELSELTDTEHALNWRPVTSVSEPLGELIDELLSKSAHDRPRSAKEVRARLLAIRTGAPSLATPSEPQESVVTPPAQPTQFNAEALANLATIAKAISNHQSAMKPTYSKSAAAALAFLGGFFGLHHWYLGRPVRGFLSFFFAGTMIPLLTSWIECARILFMDEDEFHRRYPRKHQMTSLESHMRNSLGQIGSVYEMLSDGRLNRHAFDADGRNTTPEHITQWISDLPAEIIEALGPVIDIDKKGQFRRAKPQDLLDRLRTVHGHEVSSPKEEELGSEVFR